MSRLSPYHGEIVKLRRSGWTPEMFVPGKHVTVHGHPHRDDPSTCYVEDLTIGDAPTLVRYQQLTTASPTKKVAVSMRRAR